MEKSLLSYFLPEQLLQHFEILKIEELGDITTKKDIIQITLEEINTIPNGYNPAEYESKGFYPFKSIQDFPIRGKALYLVIKCRRWRNKEDKNKVISNDYSFITEGSKLTQELSDFLKHTGQYPRRHY